MVAKDIERYKFKKGQTGNPNGRPSMRKELLGMGLNKSETYAAIGMMLKYDKPQLIEISKSDTDAVWKVCIARAILRDIARGYYSTVEGLFDRLFGKAKQSTELTGQDGNAIVFITKSK